MTDNTPETANFCKILMKINDAIKFNINGSSNVETMSENTSYLQEMWNENSMTPFHAKPKYKFRENYKSFIKQYKSTENITYWLLIVNHYNIDVKLVEHPELITRPIIFQITNISKIYNMFVCNSSLNYKYL